MSLAIRTPKKPHMMPFLLPTALTLQVAELAAFVRAQGAGSPAGVVLAGDLNCAPDTLEFAIFRVGSCSVGCEAAG